MAIDTAAIKKAVFRLLEEDEEFRYAIAAKLGLAEILDELRSIRKREEEYDKKFYEILAELRGQRRKLEEHDRRLEEHDRKLDRVMETLERHERILEEHSKKLEEHTKILEEHTRILNEHTRILNEHTEILKKHTEILGKHTEILSRHTKMLGSLGENIGVLSEAVLTRYAYEDIVNQLGGKTILVVRRRHIVNGYEVDLYIETEDEVIVVEAKTRPGKRDIEKLLRVKSFLDERERRGKRRRVRVFLASFSAKMREEVAGRAREAGVEILVY